MLTNRQLEQVRRFKTLFDWFATPAISAIYGAYGPFNTEVTSFNTNYANLVAVIPQKDVVTLGITSDKIARKQAAADALILLMDTTRSYALHYNHAALAAEMNSNAAEIFHLDDEDFLPYFQAIAQSITDNAIPDALFAPYGIVAGDLTAVLLLASQFNDLIGDAKTLAGTATVANNDINAIIKLLQANIIQFDLLITHFKTIDFDFVQNYFINASVDNVPIHHTGIEGVVTGPIPPNNAAAVPVPGVSVKLVGLNKTSVTDLLGHFSIIRVKTGTYQVEVSKTGYHTITDVVHIRRGHIESDNISITPV